MDFRIADTFTDSLARLTGDEQKSVKTTAFDLQVNPANPGLSFHKLDDARDQNFWSVRSSGDIRLIVHRSSESLLLCYVDHHDRAYGWAERRKLETHPRTGAALMGDLEELERALEYPWDKWTVFLHPAQRQWVERDFAGPARVCGSAGTGKTIVALHRAVFLARKHPDSRILLTTFSETLANALRTKLRRLISNEPRLAERLEVQALDAIGERLYERHLGPPNIASRDLTTSLIAKASAAATGQKFSLANDLANRKQRPFDFVLVDEAQDVSVPQLRFLAALGAGRPSGLFFAGDLGQRIFQPPFSWLSLGVDIRGRARTLHINYRTSHQIRTQADRLLGPAVSDVDGNTEDRRGTVSAFNGPQPRVSVFKTPDEEASAVGAWIGERVNEGVAPHEIGIFVRSATELDRAREAVTKTVLPFKVLDEHVETSHGHVSIGTMHLAKGLEFRAVAVMACDDEIVPLQARIETVTDDSDLEEVYNTERHLLYVACTRARDHLLVCGVDPASEFVEDLQIL
jgi:superfamily I DNA/RNA helicase/mRNA-degrading endonuclease RelE of RelBE toxin-antitoxin system